MYRNATLASSSYSPADGLIHGDLDRVTDSDFAELQRLSGLYTSVFGGDPCDLTQDAVFFLAHRLRDTDDWTVVSTDGMGIPLHWMDEDGERPGAVVGRGSLLRAALDDASSYQGLSLDALDEASSPDLLGRAA